MRRLLHTPAAQIDLLGYYESLLMESGDTLAALGLEAIMDRFDDLARFPDMGRPRPELDALGLQTRSLCHGGWTIVYTTRGDDLHIVRVLPK